MISVKNTNSGADFYFLNGCMRCKYGATPMCKVNKWMTELSLLRQILLETELIEEIKWGVACYTLNDKNVIMISAFKDYACISFFKGTLLEDKKKILDQHGERSQTLRIIKFTDHKEIIKQTKTIKSYVSEAIKNEQLGKKVTIKKENEPFPEELTQFLEKDKALKKSFLSLTPGRIRGYVIYFSSAKQSQTRLSRIENCRDKIMLGQGLNDDYKKNNKNQG
jgi:uncharacterized protein YdeI (YjbR/CyaY-like superfamily)